jgi:hypothetical protein
LSATHTTAGQHGRFTDDIARIEHTRYNQAGVSGGEYVGRSQDGLGRKREMSGDCGSRCVETPQSLRARLRGLGYREDRLTFNLGAVGSSPTGLTMISLGYTIIVAK